MKLQGTIGIVIPAAGQSSRMQGDDKLMRPVDGQALLARTVSAAATLGAVIVVIPPNSPRVGAIGSAMTVTCDSALGMGASIAKGVAALPPVERIMVLPADMPVLTADHLRQVASVPGWVRGAHGDKPGHPVIFPKAKRAELEALTGDEGARAVLRGQDVALVDIGPAAVIDLDTPEAWGQWERTR